jgi:DNA-binding phage protein
MKRATSKRRWKFRGICADAKALGIGREHLYKALSGERPSPSLMQRYHALKTAQNQTTHSHETKSL